MRWRWCRVDSDDSNALIVEQEEDDTASEQAKDEQKHE
jgi:hypothetical protein